MIPIPNRSPAWLARRSRVRSTLSLALLAAAGLSCSGTERLTSIASAPGIRHHLDAPGGPCAAGCTLLDGPAALWSALANPDSANVPVDVARATLRVVPGDSVVVRLAAGAAVLGSLTPAESLFAQAGDQVVGVPLASAVDGVTLLRFGVEDSVVVSYHLNRALPAVVSGPLLLSQESSAPVLAIETPWVAAQGHPAVHALAVSTACDGDLPVSATGRLCDTDVRFIQAVPADAFIGAGATFQSDAGHGQSHQIVIDFSKAVLAVEVTAYDPTWDGNTMFATDANGVVVGQHAFVANHTPGTFSQDTYRATGPIRRVVLTPPSGEYVAYSMKVRFNPVDDQPITLTPAQTGLLSPYVPSIVEPGQCNVTEQRFHRNYTVLVQRRTATGLEPVANQQVDLSLSAIDGSGGHIGHSGTRPVGSFRFGPDSISTLSVTTGTDGRAPFTYYPAEQGGLIVLTARSDGSHAKADTIRVGLPLVELAITSHMTDEGDTPFHTDNHWVTPMMGDSLRALADSVYNKFALRLGVNDESLPMGGQFDNSGAWTQPHCSHRNGRGADVKTEGRTRAYRRYIEAQWTQMFGADAVHAESTHPHLKTPR